MKKWWLKLHTKHVLICPKPMCQNFYNVLAMCLQFYSQSASQFVVIFYWFGFVVYFYILCLLLFMYLCFILDLRLNMYTYDDVLNALHDLEKKNPKVLNLPFEDNKLGKEQMIDKEVSYELDTKRYKTDVMSRDCYLRSKQESQILRNILKRKCRNYKYVKTPYNLWVILLWIHIDIYIWIPAQCRQF